MPQRYIYLPYELDEKLRSEHNVSGLIQYLLREHYKNKGIFEGNNNERSEYTLEEVREKLALLKEKFKDENTKVGEQIQIGPAINILKEKEKELELKETDKAEQQEQKKEHLTEQFKESFLMFFELSEEEAIRYAEEYYNNREDYTILEYGKEKGLKEIKDDEEDEEHKQDGEIKEAL